mgnify:CR=1 FL=1
MKHVTESHEGMSVEGSDGAHAGEIDAIVGRLLKCKRSDPNAGGKHHYLDIGLASDNEGETVESPASADEARWR